MDKELDLQGTNIVVRSGSPNVGANLRKCSVCDAKSVILLASDGATAEDSDAAMIRTTLALLEEGVNENIVVEIQSKENARLINLLCKDAQCVACPELVGRLMIQSTRGLHQVMTNVLGFDGSEFYFSKWPKLVGCTFRDAHIWFEDAVLIGFKDEASDKIDQSSPDTKIQNNMELIFFAEDDDITTKQPSKDDMKKWMQQQKPQRDEMESSKEDENETEHVL